jgi:DNA-binding NarL/FixJ family response regulator
MSRAISVLIVDDHPLVRRCLQQTLADDPDFAVVGLAANGAEAVALSQRLLPQVVVMDVAMPVMDGIQATGEILRLLPNTTILMISMTADEKTMHSAFAAGAQGYLLKNATGFDLPGAIKSALTRQPVLGSA